MSEDVHAHIAKRTAFLSVYGLRRFFFQTWVTGAAALTSDAGLVFARSGTGMIRMFEYSCYFWYLLFDYRNYITYESRRMCFVSWGGLMYRKFVYFFVITLWLFFSISTPANTLAQITTNYSVFLPFLSQPIKPEYTLVYTQCEPPDVCGSGIRTIRSIRINGDPEKILTYYESRDPSWSPDGKYIIHVKWQGTGNRIYRMDADGTNQLWLGSLLGDDPHYSPDGAKIVYVSNRGGDYEIYSANSDGANEVQLTNNIDDDVTPRWSPDGTKLLFCISTNLNNSAIYVMNANGSGKKRLSPSGNGFDYWPVWSPDGQKITFLSAGNVYVMKNDGTARTGLTNYSDHDITGYPAWSPDGSKILFAHAKEILTIHPDGTNATITHQSLYGLSSPGWSPDGTMIAFSEMIENTPGGEKWNTFILDFAANQLVQLTFNDLRATTPIWSPVKISVR